MIVTFGSVRGAPGTTSWSLLTGAAWPSEFGVERVALEADPAGGVLGARYGFGVDPGAVSLIAALRRSSNDAAVAVEDHARPLAGGLWVVPGPETGEQARSIWSGTAEDVAARLAIDERCWLVDAGRLEPTNPCTAFADTAALTVLLCRSGGEDLVQVPSRVEALQRRGARVGVLVVGKVSHSTAELAEFFGTPLVWRVGASDELVALTGAVLQGGRGRRSWLWRNALEVAGQIATAACAVPAHRRGRFELNGEVRSSLGGRGVR